MTERIIIEKEWLIEQYVKKRRSAKNIADEIGCCEKTIFNKLNKFKIPIRTFPTKIHIDKEWLYKKYIIEKKSSRVIAKEVGCGKKKILRTLHEYNIPVRTEKKGKYNSQWKGDKIGYKAIHKWLRDNCKQPKQCELCGTETKKLELACKSETHVRDINNYQWLCHKCHMNKDNARPKIKEEYFQSINSKLSNKDFIKNPMDEV